MSDAWIDEYFAAWNGSDAKAVVDWMTDDVEYEDTTAPHLSHGREAALTFVDVCFKRVPASYEVISKVSTDEAFAIEWVMRPEKSDVAVRGSSVGTLRDGKISRNRDYWNGAIFTV
jgi:ketosteroid isomerase-like protein